MGAGRRAEARVSAFSPHQLPPARRAPTRHPWAACGKMDAMEPPDLIELLRAGVSRLDDLAPRDLEEVVAELLASMGWEVSLTAPSRDGGVDILGISKGRCRLRDDLGSRMQAVSPRSPNRCSRRPAALRRQGDARANGSAAAERRWATLAGTAAGTDKSAP